MTILYILIAVSPLCTGCHPTQVSDYHYLPDTGKRAERVKLCLQEGEELPRDFTALFDSSLYNLDTSVLPDAIKLVHAAA